MKGRRVWGTALDLLAGFLGAAAVIVATDATNADLRVYFVASVAVFFAIGLTLMIAPKIPWLGRLPGDILIRRKNFTLYFPLATSIVLSIILTVLTNMFRK